MRDKINSRILIRCTGIALVLLVVSGLDWY
jgi:succinate dehydrogenase hydrophobic anchor subunit